MNNWLLPKSIHRLLWILDICRNIQCFIIKKKQNLLLSVFKRERRWKLLQTNVWYMLAYIPTKTVGKKIYKSDHSQLLLLMENYLLPWNEETYIARLYISRKSCWSASGCHWARETIWKQFCFRLMNKPCMAILLICTLWFVIVADRNMIPLFPTSVTITLAFVFIITLYSGGAKCTFSVLC